MYFTIDVFWSNDKYKMSNEATIPVYCSPYSDAYDKGINASEALDEWYFDSAISAAADYYNENRLDLEGVDYDRFIDDFLEDCTVNYHLSV